MTLEEIMALEATTRHGMSPEEIARRHALIQRVAQHSPDIARDIASGPYRIRSGKGTGNSPARGSHPSEADPYANMQPPTQGGSPARGPSTPAAPSAGAVTKTGVRTVPSSPQGPPITAYASPPSPTEPVGNPRYDFPENATGSRAQTSAAPTTTINVNLGGMPQGTTIPDWMKGYNPVAPIAPNDPYSYMPPSLGGQPSAMHNPDYPMSPGYRGPSTPSGYAQSMWDNNFMSANPNTPRPVTVIGADGSQQTYQNGQWVNMPPTFGNLSR